MLNISRLKIPGTVGTAELTRIRKGAVSKVACHIDSRQYEYLAKFNQIGRNDPCYCGSGKKYKKCCMTTSSRELVEKLNKEAQQVKQLVDKEKNSGESKIT